MQQHSREVLKDVTTALQLEQELQLSQAQHGVAVLDVYSSEWGNTKVLSETFRRLYTDAGDQMHLRFYSVECNSVLESLKFPEEQRNPQRPKNLELCRETLPTFWEGILLGRRGKSKSYFVFYKEGKRRAFIEGVDTPKIVSCVRELCRIQKPAEECTSNAELLKFWDQYFSAAESEVFFESFVSAVQDHIAAKRPFTERERKTLAEAVGAADGKVLIQALEAWIGDNETIESAFTHLFPVHKEVPEAPSTVLSGGGDGSVDGSRNNMKHAAVSDWTEEGVFANALELPTGLRQRDAKWRPELWHRVAATPLHVPDNTHLLLLSCEEGESEAAACLQRVSDIPTLHNYLADMGVADADIQVMCHAAAERISSTSLEYGKLGLVLMLSDRGSCEELLGRQEGLFEHLSEGTLMAQHLPLAFAVLSLCASEVPADTELYYCNDASTVPAADGLKTGDAVVLPPFSRLCLDRAAEGVFTVKFLGLPQVIALPTAETEGETVVLSPWYAKFHVTDREENAVTLTFAGNVGEESFRHSAQLYTERLVAEDTLPKLADIVYVLEHPLGYEQAPEPLSLTDPHLLDRATAEHTPEHEVYAPENAVDDNDELSEGDVAKLASNASHEADAEL
ncbi:hypothetical protein TraAM80_04179 [Trypanosoma rangeli]|uniref:Uncharacterized protein n=1 Tax=Trypanosoma rangeli TaxID=5698 RepID=A0A3R7KDT8_TRYRA|nr:uncharacterized protein TraAM80_04179 [Trypanosoma rangeli]RNF06025.1 hypothetical protein TraAM80_04179 [Trypanosoma rangeli]|eukprot:RNF06025.1 hypothetical protein TraAM80_04179 [Trypanosoma rangeli]